MSMITRDWYRVWMKAGASGPTLSASQVATYDTFARQFQRSWGLPQVGTPLTVGDPLPGRSVFGDFRHALAGLDDRVLRPIVKLSPFLLGGGLGFFGSLGIKALLAAGAVAYIAPSDWKISKFAQGILSGAAGRLIWNLPWGKLWYGFEVLGSPRLPGPGSGGLFGPFS